MTNYIHSWLCPSCLAPAFSASATLALPLKTHLASKWPNQGSPQEIRLLQPKIRNTLPFCACAGYGDTRRTLNMQNDAGEFVDRYLPWKCSINGTILPRTTRPSRWTWPRLTRWHAGSTTSLKPTPAPHSQDGGVRWPHSRAGQGRRHHLKELIGEDHRYGTFVINK